MFSERENYTRDPETTLKFSSFSFFCQGSAPNFQAIPNAEYTTVLGGRTIWLTLMV